MIISMAVTSRRNSALFVKRRLSVILKLMSQLQKSNLLRLRRRYTPRNDRKDAICLCERVSRSPEGNEGEAIPLLNTFAITSYLIFYAAVYPVSRNNASNKIFCYYN